MWGASNLFTKIGVGGIPPMQFACLRFFLAGVVLLTVALLRGERLSFSPEEWKSLLKIGLLMNFLTNGCVVISNTLIDSSVVTVMMATTPIFAALFELVVGKAAKRAKTLLGMAGGFIGILIVVLCGSGKLYANGKGVLVILTGVLFWTTGTLYSKQKSISGSVFSQTAVEALFSSLLFFGASRLTGSIPLSGISAEAMIPVLYLAIFDSVIGFASYIYLLKVMPASKVCTYAYINPVVALILGNLFLKEQLIPGKILGMAIIIGSVIFIQRERPVCQ